MRAFSDFIVKPIGDRYNNSKKVGDKELILNTKIETFKAVNNLAEVISVPIAYESSIKIGDKVIIHHNIFRRFYDIRGKQKNSRSYYQEDLYFVQPDQIYMYGDYSNWKAFNDRCFVAPIENTDDLSLKKEQSLIGILKYGNDVLNKLKINPGDLVGFKPNSEFEFVIDDQLLYCMKSKDIVIKYEYKGNETQYNPSWTKSS